MKKISKSGHRRDKVSGFNEKRRKVQRIPFEEMKKKLLFDVVKEKTE